MNPNQQKRYISREFKKRGLSLQPATLTALLNVLRREEEINNTSSSGNRKKKRSTNNGGNNNDNQNDILQILLNEIKQRMMNANDKNNNSSSSNHLNSNGNNYTNGGGGGGGGVVIYNQSIVTPEILQNVVADLSRDGNDVLDEALQLLNAWKMKRLDYHVMKKRWSLVEDGEEEGKIQNNRGAYGGGDGIHGQKRSGRSVFGNAGDKVSQSVIRIYCTLINCGHFEPANSQIHSHSLQSYIRDNLSRAS